MPPISSQKWPPQHEPKATYANFDDMLADPKVEAIIIGVADQFHVPLARQAIAAGKHVLVEKPLGVSIEECEALRAEVQGSKRVLQIGNNRRFDPGVAFARRFIQRGNGPDVGLEGVVLRFDVSLHHDG